MSCSFDRPARTTEQHTKPAVCPLGFGSATGPQLSVLHCTICRTLMHQPVAIASCGHKFCSYCISRCSDCPLCGRDVDSLKPDTETEGLLDFFLKTHSKNTELWKSMLNFTAVQDPSTASFFLQLGLQSFAGGNYNAAYDRLEQCRSVMEVDMKQAGTDALLASKLGTVLGSMGDCCRQLQNEQKAIQLYEQSLRLLEPQADQDAEVAHALSVSLNKMGDIYYTQSKLQQARETYERALFIRQSALEAGSVSASTSAQVFDVATSMIKVADACKALSEHERAVQNFRAAKQLLEQLADQGREKLDARAAAKHTFLMQLTTTELQLLQTQS